MSWPSETATEALRQADFLAERSQWGKALPLYKEAERQLLVAGDITQAWLARLGGIRASVKEHHPQKMYDALKKEIANYPGRKDAEVYLKALFIKADVESDVDALCAGTFSASQRRREWQEILALSQKLGDSHLEIRAQGELGILKILDGEAIGSDEVSAVLWRTVENDDAMNELRFRTAIANLYNSAGRSDDALGHLDRAIELAEREQALSYFPTFFEKAIILLTSNRLQEAVPLVEYCASQASITGSAANNAQALYLRGSFHYRNGRISESVILLKQALNLASEIGYHRLVSRISLDLSQIYRIRNELWKSLNCADVGLQSSLKIGDPMEAILHLQNKAAIRAGQGRFIEADRLYSEALQSLNGQLRKFTSAHSRASMTARMSSLYTDYFSLCLHKLNDPAKAFMILEQARGRSLSDTLRGRRIDSTWAGGENSENPSEKYEKSLSRLQAKLWVKNPPQEYRRIQSEIFDLEQHLGSSREAGRHNIAAQIFSPIPLSEVQKSLYPAEVILEYVLGEPSSTCLVISRSGVHGIMLASKRVIEDAVAGYRNKIQQGRDGAQYAQKLHNLLLASIPGLSSKPRITIIPDGLLHLLPFEAISTPSGRFMLESHMIDYSPSATITHILRKNPLIRTGKRRLLGVGDVRYPTSNESGSSYFNNQPQSARLEGSLAEILSIAESMKSDADTMTLLGEGVGESAIKSLLLKDYDIFHFAVHGVSDPNFPDRSALLFGPQIDEMDDGIFQAWEISRLRLKTDLVVLSACDTATGKVLEQEGISNLVKAFLWAGARSVVASIWPMEDRSTAELMSRFYSYLAKGMDKGSALRQAKLDFIKEYKGNALPKHWAGMLMIGESSDSLFIEPWDNDAEE
ncbi:MAG: CHAT domain-containing protein [Acidobacteria bacterium]|nr:CHAT domain-containing protein [Acidobacteriota bacterium]